MNERDYDTRSSIRTRYLAPTNHRGSRIVVMEDGVFGSGRRRLYVDWDHALNTGENYGRAAQKWLDKFNEFDAVINSPGLTFGGDYFWTWGFKTGKQTR